MMNCRQFQKRYRILLDPEPDPAAAAALREHMAGCPECAQMIEEDRRILDALRPSLRAHARPHFKERVMKKIHEVEKAETAADRPRSGRWIFRLKLAAAAAALWLVAIASYNWLAARNGQPAKDGFSVLAQAAEAVSRLNSIHLTARMRTSPGDNFSYINPELDFVPIEAWMDYAAPKPHWRLEEPLRVFCSDGATIMILTYQNPDKKEGVWGWRKPSVSPAPPEGFLGSIIAKGLLQREVSNAKAEGSSIVMGRKSAPDGAPQTVLTVEAKAKGDFSKSDHTRNGSIETSDNIRVYTFDARTLQPVAIQVYMKTAKGKTLVFETTRIEYNAPLAPEIFNPAPPPGIVWSVDPDELPAAPDTSKLTAKEAAQQFFMACAAKDWDTVRVFGGTIFADTPRIREFLGGLTLVSVGEPFKAGLYPGWFVPYEIKIQGKWTKKFNLAIRNDNPKKMWKVDGGI